jgi:hypothetical protein
MRTKPFLTRRVFSPGYLAASLLACALAGIFSIPIAAAQTVSGPDAAGNFTTTDANGNAYMFNLNNVSTTGTSTLPVTVTPAGGTPQSNQVAVQNTGPNLFSVNGTLATGAISCIVNAQTRQVVSGNCPIFSALFMTASGTQVSTGLSPAQAAAMAAAPSTQNAAVAAVRSQTLAVTDMISERIRSISAGSLSPA